MNLEPYEPYGIGKSMKDWVGRHFGLMYWSVVFTTITIVSVFVYNY